MDIVEGRLRDPQVLALLTAHAEGMLANSPKESCHFLDLSALESPAVSFFTAWDDDQLLGMGALKELDASHGEIKSMRTVASALGKGVGAGLLNHILSVACARGYHRLSLETGSTASFEPALRLYARFGFVESGAFGGYPAHDPFSRFLTREL